MGLEFDFSLPMPAQTYDFGARIELEFRGATNALKRTVGKTPSPYWSGPHKSGLFYLYYEVPDEIERECVLNIAVVEAAADGYYTSSPEDGSSLPTWESKFKHVV